jgi:hypothetical protein
VIVPRPRPITCAGAVLLSWVALSGGEARAAPLTVRLEYAAGPGCPAAADFKAAVISRLGYDPFVETANEQVIVRAEPRDRSVDGRIEWRDASGKWSGEQTFPSVSTDCPRLVRAMGLALAVQIQLLARATAAPDGNVAAPAETASPPLGGNVTVAKPSITAPPSPTEATTSVAAAGSAPTTGPRPVFAVGMGPAVGFGMSSQPVMLGRLVAVVAWPRASLELAGVVSLPATTRRADGAGFSQQLLVASAAACATSSRWNACVVANGGVARMAGENIDRPSSASVPIIEAGTRVRFMQRLGAHGFLSGYADGLVNVTRWTGTLDNVPVWTAPRFAGAIGVDAGVRFR